MALPALILTGASGFLGRHLLEAIKERYRVFGIARRTQRECGAPVHPNISWHQVDIGDIKRLEAVFQAIQSQAEVEVLVHLAAHYDFTGEEHPEYWRTNVGGTRNILEIAKGMPLKRFIFASSVAACNFPPKGKALDELSPPDGEHLYAVTKRIGEEMLQKYLDRVPSCTVRFGALFSDWCEYAPLFMFFQTWLSKTWNSRILGGKGLSAIPYVHIRDAVLFMTTLLERYYLLPPGTILICSTDGAVTHNELFDATTSAYYGQKSRPIHMPKPLARVGIVGRDWMGRITGNRPFERPWMGKYIDLALTVDASRTRQRLGWAPRPRLGILRRIPFLVEHCRTEPLEWARLNRAAMKEVHVHSNLMIHNMLEAHETELRELLAQRLLTPELADRFRSYHRISPEDLDWSLKLVLRQLMHAVKTRNKSLFIEYCRDLAERRFEMGFEWSELASALEAVGEVCLDVLKKDPASKGLDEALNDHISMTIQLGVDESQEVYEQLGGASILPKPPESDRRLETPETGPSSQE